jgi:hypothetical protein
MAFALHHSALALGWAHDDPYLLECAIFQNPFGFFWDPSVHQRVSIASFSPMLVLSYAVDYALFGAEPGWFYGHQVFLLGLIAVGIFLFARPWNAWVAALAGLLFLLSGPATVTSRLLMTRHYLEGACWALAVALLLRSADKPGWKTWLAGLACLAAALCKEVYMLLALLAPFLVHGPWQRALRCSIPCGLAVVVYIPWRLVMLSGFGGYHDHILERPLDVGTMLGGWRGIAAMLCSQAVDNQAAFWLAALMTAGVLLLAWLLRNQAKALLGCATVLVVALAPMIPVWIALLHGDFHAHRLTLHLAVPWCIGIAYLLARGASLIGRIPHLVAAGMVSLITAATFFLWLEQRDLSIRHQESVHTKARLYRFVLTEDPQKTLVCDEHLSYWRSLARIRRLLRGDDAPVVCTAPFDLRQNHDTRYFGLSPKTGEFLDISDMFKRQSEQLAARLTDSGPFSVAITVSRGLIRFEFDKGQPKGTYLGLIDTAPNVYQARPSGPTVIGMRTYIPAKPFHVRVVKIFPDGELALSPAWEINLERDRSIRWSQ